MSAIRKLRQQKQKALETAVRELSDDADDVEVEAPESAAPNPFNFLEEDENASAEPADEAEEDTVADVAPAKKGAGKKAKHTNKKKKSAVKEIVDAAPESGDKTSSNVDEEVSRIMKSLDSITPATTDVPAETKDISGAACLKTQTVCFNPDVEVKRVFGRAVLQIARDDDDHKQRNSHARANWKRTKLVRSEDSYPVVKDMEMILEGKTDGASVFRFQYTRDFQVCLLDACFLFPRCSLRFFALSVCYAMGSQRTQHEYEQCAATHDPNTLGYFLRQYPFHPQALLQMVLSIGYSQSSFVGILSLCTPTISESSADALQRSERGGCAARALCLHLRVRPPSILFLHSGTIPHNHVRCDGERIIRATFSQVALRAAILLSPFAVV